MQEMIQQDRIHFDSDHSTIPKVKRYLHELEGQVLPSVFYRDRRASIMELRDILGGDAFANPKDVSTLEKLIEAATVNDSWVADYFAGSGATAHAVIAHNREVGGSRRFLMVDMGEYFEYVLKRRIVKIMFAEQWKDGLPAIEPRVDGQPPQWVERSPRLVQVLELESYEDSLNNLESAGVLSGNAIRYAMPSVSEDSPTLLATARLERPFDYQLDVHTEDGVSLSDVDVIATFNLLKGIRVRRYRESDHGGRRYVMVEGDEGSERVLVVWREIAGLDAEAEKDFLRTAVMRTLGAELSSYNRIYHNADSAVPNSVSLDAEFKRLMFEPEPALA